MEGQGKLGFGSRLLISQGFLGAKAGHSDQRFCRWKLLFYQQPCAKAKEFGFRRILGLFAGFFMEESCRGFFVSNWLCSKPGRSLCERIKLTFAIAPGCLHSLSLGRHDRFGRLCNLGLPKTLRFSLQRHKTQEFGLRRIPEIVYRFPSWSVFPPLGAGGLCPDLARGLRFLIRNGFLGAKAPMKPAGCVRIWLGAFGKAVFFRCQSRIQKLGFVALDRLGVLKRIVV